jgi:hypothetical protein
MSKKIKPNRRRRVCKFSGCTHILSIYNPENHCYVHQQLVMARESSSSMAFIRH